MEFIQQAYKGKNKWSSYLATILLIFLASQILGGIPMGIAAAYYTITSGSSIGGDLIKSLLNMGINRNLLLVLIIFSFAMALVALLWSVKIIHRRKIITVLTSRKKLDRNRILFAFIIWFVITATFIFVPYFLSDDLVWNFKPIPFLILTLISFFLLPMQTSFEEVFFRGYLMQGFGTWLKRPWIALVITSVMFGLMHFANPEVEKLGMGIMVFYIGTGLVLGLMTLFDEGLELALGFHAANNIASAILATSTWSALQTDALLIDTSEPTLTWSSYFPVFVLYPLIILIFSKKYGWKNWKEKLFGRVYPPVEINEDELIA